MCDEKGGSSYASGALYQHGRTVLLHTKGIALPVEEMAVSALAVLVLDGLSSYER